MKRKIVIALLILLFIGTAAYAQITKDFPLDKYKVTQQYIPMSDGIYIAATIIFPAQLKGSRPVIFQYLPYRRYIINPETGETQFFLSQQDRVKKYIDNGYIFVIADMRGSGASSGNRLAMSPQLGQDGKEIIDWIASQAWCDGNVGMTGGSYVGWSQFATAGHRPKALKCIMPEIIAFDLYNDAFFMGGIQNKGTLDNLSELFGSIDVNSFIPDSAIPDAKIWPTLPVVDEDRDGNLADEIPVDVNQSGNFLDDGYPPQYRDGKVRKNNVYYQATAAHKANLTMGEWGKVKFRDDKVAGTSMAEKGPNDWPTIIAESKIPVYVVGGWFDLFTRGSFQWYDTLKTTNPCKILMHPSFHAESGGPYWDYFKINVKEYDDWRFNEGLRFFDRYLKEEENDFENDPPIRFYVMNGDEWREEKEWPLARQKLTDYYFGADNALATHLSEGFSKYKVDLTHSATYGSNKGTRWIPGENPSVIMDRTEKDLQCFTYTTAPLEKDAEVTGHPIITLYVSSTADDGDFYIYLEDVDEKGEALYVTEGTLRAGFAALKSNEGILLSGKGVDVLPNLPWHGFKKSDYKDTVFAGGKVVKLVIDMLPTAWVFKAGHKIRISIAGADWPTFELNPKLSPKNDPKAADTIVPTVTIYHNAKYPSHIELPVIPEG
ncbi:MAG: CocE/NonD family hydrolase [Candidatus Margulisbacteria bacterium]|nr:CocE/NonD family hydrolase [Candidatus Margulisiibacteriota bacterium]MBU1022287.1 CocE/NonD family hydrolase [Candidatus Margulisiibacteriota bacterium]MBU1729274.1 CocE/NonD family hydrolase [Candidatus Margulisiibacteriota bacterium]MBU1955547.1 CocE/NonD family hydrolase [Candidatus Margulisiibacteriota bacterium]